ncbi:unnamed protein product [Acanthosepion pharaonis]|uniref:Uncharacterized protein n=1 Tax=Acanthosepion pharaonis TaxID=158019 RepID=A0A812DFS7_ACAPH|nr:unnamed protein product [Sepia pharaonis]
MAPRPADERQALGAHPSGSAPPRTEGAASSPPASRRYPRAAILVSNTRHDELGPASARDDRHIAKRPRRPPAASAASTPRNNALPAGRPCAALIRSSRDSATMMAMRLVPIDDIGDQRCGSPPRHRHGCAAAVHRAFDAHDARQLDRGVDHRRIRIHRQQMRRPAARKARSVSGAPSGQRAISIAAPVAANPPPQRQAARRAESAAPRASINATRASLAGRTRPAYRPPAAPHRAAPSTRSPSRRA